LFSSAGVRLKKRRSYDEERDVSKNTDVSSLSRSELIALVQQLRQQLAERDREIEVLRRQSAENRRGADPQAPDSSLQGTSSPWQQEPSPGSQEDLLALLEQLYPEGR
jgi:hypothetical protein